MTKEEFINQFNTLVSAPTLDHAALATFRAQVEADYDASATTQTTLTTAQETITNLTNQNNQLKDTNLRLFMMNPINTNSPDGKIGDGKTGGSNPPSDPPTDPPTNTPSDDLGNIIDLLVGNVNNK